MNGALVWETDPDSRVKIALIFLNSLVCCYDVNQEFIFVRPEAPNCKWQMTKHFWGINQGCSLLQIQSPLLLWPNFQLKSRGRFGTGLRPARRKS